VSRHGILKLCDFGFARPLGGPGARYTDYVATRWYRSPELLAGDTQYGRGVDIWAIGCMLAEIYTGMPLFPGESDVDQLFQIVRCQGNLTEHLGECLRQNPLFDGVDVPYVSEAETLKRRLPQFDSGMIALMSACLGIDPSTRASCTDLLEMEYFRGFHEWWTQEYKRLAEKDIVGYRGRYRKRTKKTGQNVHEQRSEMPVGEIELEARKRFDNQRKVMDDERQPQVCFCQSGLCVALR
jgi:cyclin-dependent kinase-like